MSSSLSAVECVYDSKPQTITINLCEIETLQTLYKEEIRINIINNVNLNNLQKLKRDIKSLPLPEAIKKWLYKK